jgi:diacylglycerol kinase
MPLRIIKSFSYACNGIKLCFKLGINFNIHLFAAALAVLLALLLRISKTEWALLVLMIALVIAIEQLCDKMEPDFHPLIKIVKDIAAGAVLVIAACSIIIGDIIFLPAIANLFKI